jgi:hypothetical protein
LHTLAHIEHGHADITLDTRLLVKEGVSALAPVLLLVRVEVESFAILVVVHNQFLDELVLLVHDVLRGVSAGMYRLFLHRFDIAYAIRLLLRLFLFRLLCFHRDLLNICRLLASLFDWLLGNCRHFAVIFVQLVKPTNFFLVDWP